MKAIKQTSIATIQNESPRALLFNAAGYGILFGAWLIIQLSK